MRHSKALILAACIFISAHVNCEPFRFPDGSSTYTSPNLALKMPVPELSGAERAVSVGFEEADPTNDVAVIDRNNWMLAVVYTRIRPDYPKDFSLIEQRVMPLKLKIAEQRSPELYKVSVQTRAGMSVFEEQSFSPGLDLPADIEFLRHAGPSFSGTNKFNQRRFDLWYVRNGYLVQIIAVSNDKTGLPVDSLMSKAQDIATSAFGNIVISESHKTN